MKYYWYNTCPACNQGRLIITKNITASTLYLHCEECEQGWPTPNDVDLKINNFLTLLEDYETEIPSLEEISNYGWKEFAKNSFEI